MSKKQVLEDLLLRTPLLRPHNLHYNSKRIRARLSEPPKPLAFPLKPLPEGHQFLTKPLGSISPIPFHVLKKKYIKNSHFYILKVERTHMGNLPVYVKYRHHRNVKKTIIRLVSGDIEVTFNLYLYIYLSF
jgi:hypothetical protein